MGDPEAYRELFNYTYPRLKGYCRLFVTDEKQAEDIIQDCFISLWDKRKSINSEKSVENYLFVMVRNRCLNYLKTKKLEEGTIRIEDLKSIELQHLYQLDFTEMEEKSLEELLVRSFKEAVEELPEKKRYIFRRCKIEGQKQSEVANELGITVKAVEKHIAEAKQQIRNKLIFQYPSLIIIITMLLD